MVSKFTNCQIKSQLLQFSIALAYVGFGTLSVCSVYPADLFAGEWSTFGLLITFLVSIISFGYRFADSLRLYPVFVIQAVMFVLTFLILAKLAKSKKR